MYINLLYLYLILHIYSFFLFFLSFPLNVFVSFIFIVLFPSWHLALVLFSSLCFSQFYSGGYNFWFPLFTRSIYCTLFLLDCFDFDCGYICIHLYSVTFFIVINLCLYVGLLQFCRVFFFFPFFLFSFISFLFFIILIFKPVIFFYIYSFVCLSYCSFPLAVNL